MSNSHQNFLDNWSDAKPSSPVSCCALPGLFVGHEGGVVLRARVVVIRAGVLRHKVVHLKTFSVEHGQRILRLFVSSVNKIFRHFFKQINERERKGGTTQKLWLI